MHFLYFMDFMREFLGISYLKKYISRDLSEYLNGKYQSLKPLTY